MIRPLVPPLRRGASTGGYHTACAPHAMIHSCSAGDAACHLSSRWVVPSGTGVRRAAVAPRRQPGVARANSAGPHAMLGPRMEDSVRFMVFGINEMYRVCAAIGAP